MERRDYLLYEIEKIGILLNGILGRLINDKSAKQYEQTSTALLESMDFSFDDFIEMDDDTAHGYINTRKGLNNTNLETLSKILEELASGDSKHRKKLLMKALLILEYARDIDHSYSLEREERIRILTEKLSVRE